MREWDTASQWIMVVAVTFLLIGAFMAASQRDELKSEAVKRGFAEWVSDYNGNTTFKWKEGAK
jgi:glucose uptake protein GlcU